MRRALFLALLVVGSSCPALFSDDLGCKLLEQGSGDLYYWGLQPSGAACLDQIEPPDVLYFDYDCCVIKDGEGHIVDCDTDCMPQVFEGCMCAIIVVVG